MEKGEKGSKRRVEDAGGDGDEDEDDGVCTWLKKSLVFAVGRRPLVCGSVFWGHWGSEPWPF